MDKLRVYPNPASLEATISIFSDHYEYGRVRLTDSHGNRVKTMDIDSHSTKKLDLRGLVPGIYVVEYISFISGGRDVEKLVVLVH